MSYYSNIKGNNPGCFIETRDMLFRGPTQWKPTQRTDVNLKRKPELPSPVQSQTALWGSGLNESVELLGLHFYICELQEIS